MKTIPVLISYAYENCFKWDKISSMSSKLDLLIDCGAFTVHKKGKSIRLEEYYDFLSKIDFPLDGYFMLDSIGDHVQTMKNFHAMLNQGYDPIPIFTRGSPLPDLEEYYKYADLVALGGLWAGGENDPGYVKYIMEEGFKGRKTHWLGFAIHYLMCHFNPTSVDAINWKRALLYGQLVVWDGMKFHKAGREDFKNKGIPPFAKVIQKYGYDPYELKNEESWRGVITLAHEISTVSFMKYVRDLKKRKGIKFYFVCNAQHELDFLLRLNNGEKNLYLGKKK